MKYFEEFSNRVKNYSEIYDLLNKRINVDFKSDSVDYISYTVFSAFISGREFLRKSNFLVQIIHYQ